MKIFVSSECPDFWDDFAKANSSLLFHRSIWARVLRDGYGGMPLFCWLERDGTPVVGMMGAIMDYKVVRVFYAALPYGGLIGDDSAAPDFIKLVEPELRNRGVHKIQIPEPRHAPILEGAGFTSTEIARHQVNVAERDIKSLQASFPRSVRKAIRKSHKENVEIREVLDRSEIDGVFELYMKTQDVLLRSDALADRAKEVLEEKYDGDLPIIGGGMKQGLRIERVSGSQIVNLHFTSFDPEFSALAANTLAEEFILLHYERKVDTTNKAAEFLGNQLETLKQNVEKAEADLVQYAQENDILSTDGNQQNVIREQFGLLSTEVGRAENNYLTIQAEADELNQITVDNFPASMRGQEITGLENDVLAAEQELSRLLVRFGENKAVFHCLHLLKAPYTLPPILFNLRRRRVMGRGCRNTPPLA